MTILFTLRQSVNVTWKETIGQNQRYSKAVKLSLMVNHNDRPKRDIFTYELLVENTPVKYSNGSRILIFLTISFKNNYSQSKLNMNVKKDNGNWQNPKTENFKCHVHACLSRSKVNYKDEYNGERTQIHVHMFIHTLIPGGPGWVESIKWIVKIQWKVCLISIQSNLDQVHKSM